MEIAMAKFLPTRGLFLPSGFLSPHSARWGTAGQGWYRSGPLCALQLLVKVKKNGKKEGGGGKLQ